VEALYRELTEKELIGVQDGNEERGRPIDDDSTAVAPGSQYSLSATSRVASQSTSSSIVSQLFYLLLYLVSFDLIVIYVCSKFLPRHVSHHIRLLPPYHYPLTAMNPSHLSSESTLQYV